MACGLALKRPHDYESYLNGSESPDGGPSEAKRHCPPFRAQLGTIAASLPSHNAAALLNKNSSDSPFAAVASRCQLTSPQLDAFLRAEIRYLRRRRVIPRRCSVEANAAGGAADEDEGLGEPPFKLHAEYRAAPKSPQSGSDSDGEPSNSSMRASTTVSKNGDASRMMPTSSAVASTLAMVDRPQFSLRQVQLICERLLKEQELRLRGEFENALNRRLEEQHDQYVQFAEEQLSTRRAEVTVGECSYLS